MLDNYNIDDLVNTLLKERESAAPSPTEVDAADDETSAEVQPEETPSVPTEEKSAAANMSATPPKTAEPMTPPAVAEEETEDVGKRRKRLFGRKKEDTASFEAQWADYGLKPIGQYQSKAASLTPLPDVQKDEEPVDATLPSVEVNEAVEAEAPQAMDEFPAVKAVSDTITMQVVLPSGVAMPRAEQHTRVVPDVSRADELFEEPKPKSAPKSEPVLVLPTDEQLPDQLSLEEMVRVEDIEPAEGDAPEEDVDPEERLQRTREEKIRAFTLDGEEEENEPDEEPVAEEEPEIEDFTGYQDTEVVAAELKYRCRSTLLSVLFSGATELILLALTLLTVIVEYAPFAPLAYLLIHLFGLVLLMGLNYATVTRGLSGLFTLRANNDTAPALASVVCLTELVVHLFDITAPLPYWTPLAGLLLVLSAVAHHKQEASVRRNFAFVSYPGDKYAAAIVEDEGALQEIGRRAVSDGDATVAYFRRTGFLTDYLSNAYETDGGDDWSRWLAPSALGLSLLLSWLSLFSEHVTGMWDWLSVFTGMVCISMPVTLLAVQSFMSGSCRRMLACGGFLNGWKAVRTFGQPDALAVDIADLYPDESMLLHGIKLFSGTHIDEAILTAASLAVRSGGPLAMIFRRIIEDRVDLLFDVDSLVYEQGMGLSGWVDGRRVFVGNGRLLQNHGVDVPSADYEARYAKDGRRLVYLSVAGQLSAMFVVSYLPDPEIQSALQDLCRARVTLLVRSCDPNITTSDLCESFGLDEYYVDVLPAAAGRLYVQLTEQTADNLPAVMASNGHILGTAKVLSVCRGLQGKVTLALIIQSIFAVLGLIMCLLWTMNGQLSLFQPLVWMLASLFFSWIIPLLWRG